MKKFWDKTKETVASGVAKIDSQYDKIIKENPEYEEKIKCLNEFNDVINNLQDSIPELTNMIRKFGCIIDNFASNIDSTFQKDDEENEIGSKTKDVAERIKRYCNNISEYNIPTFVESPLNYVKNKIDELKKMIEERKKHHALYIKEDDELKNALIKKKNIQEHQEKTRKQKEIFEQLDQRVHDEMSDIHERKKEIYQSIFSAIMFYSNEIMILTLDEIESNLPEFSFDNNKSKFPSCTQPPPVFQTNE